MGKKTILWQYFTKKDIWLKTHIKNFILDSKRKIAFDPFAGDGELLKVGSSLWLIPIWCDIDKSLNREINDSLENIPHKDNCIIITNPPYLSNYSAERKKIYQDVAKYFQNSKHEDLYKIAMDKCLENNDFIVAIIPETFVNSGFNFERLNNITILEENPFEDTETPVCVACFDNIKRWYNKIKVYKNDEFIWNLDFFEKERLTPSNLLKLKFNEISWQIALRAVDMPSPEKRLEFMKKEKLVYNMNNIKNSSRLITIIKIEDEIDDLDSFIKWCNDFLNEYRKKTQDILFSPFKGNSKDWTRRRRLDYKAARAIIEKVYMNLNINKKTVYNWINNRIIKLKKHRIESLF